MKEKGERERGGGRGGEEEGTYLFVCFSDRI